MGEWHLGGGGIGQHHKNDGDKLAAPTTSPANGIPASRDLFPPPERNLPIRTVD
jgi:hypothetical protein